MIMDSLPLQPHLQPGSFCVLFLSVTFFLEMKYMLLLKVLKVRLLSTPSQSVDFHSKCNL